MAHAACSQSLGAIAAGPAPRFPAQLEWMVLDVTVPSCDVLRVRRALVNRPQVGILRCMPRPDERLARLEIRLPAHLAGEVMDEIMGGVSRGELGRLISWRHHLQKHGLNHGR